MTVSSKFRKKDKYIKLYGEEIVNALLKESENLNIYASKILLSYKKWINMLDIISYDYTYKDFIKCYRHKVNQEKNCKIMHISFYQNKFYYLDYEFIFQKYKSYLLEKRGSAYDPVHISKKRNITIEEATVLVNNRKQKTAGTLENFISRHGDFEGRRKFEIFKQKSKNSIENYKIRYGNKWEDKWDHFLNTRDSSSLKYWVNKLGEKDGNAKFLKVQDTCRSISTLQFYVDKFGEDLGRKEFDRVIEEKSLVGNFASELANKFFSQLEYHLGRDLQYGSIQTELRIFSPERDTYYFFDCYDELTNTIIEFHGNIFHADPRVADKEKYVNFQGFSWNYLKERDILKEELARSHQYDYIVVWEHEVNILTKTKEKINQISEYLNGKTKNSRR